MIRSGGERRSFQLLQEEDEPLIGEVPLGSQDVPDRSGRGAARLLMESFGQLVWCYPAPVDRLLPQEAVLLLPPGIQGVRRTRLTMSELLAL